MTGKEFLDYLKFKGETNMEKTKRYTIVSKENFNKECLEEILTMLSGIYDDSAEAEEITINFKTGEYSVKWLEEIVEE